MLSGARRRSTTLLRDRRGVAILEFALALPLFVTTALYAVELTAFALDSLRLSQATLALSDNISRVGVDTSLATQQLREADINEVINGLRQQTRSLGLTARGRITISSLEVKDGTQWIHWQRCVGVKSGDGYDSSFGHQGDGGRSGTKFVGMGDPAKPVTAPQNAAVIFVEVNYDYEPLISQFFLGERKLSQTASFLVRDNRDLAAGVATSPNVPEPLTCDRHTV